MKKWAAFLLIEALWFCVMSNKKITNYYSRHNFILHFQHMCDTKLFTSFYDNIKHYLSIHLHSMYECSPFTPFIFIRSMMMMKMTMILKIYIWMKQLHTPIIHNQQQTFPSFIIHRFIMLSFQLLIIKPQAYALQTRR